MFNDSQIFNQPLDNWDVSNVTDMTYMFNSAQNFNQPLNNWNVSNVTVMVRMFMDAQMFNQPLDNWDVSNVTDMSYMFSNAQEFNQPLDNWNVSNVTNMDTMFSDNPNFNQPLNNWDVSNVTNMSYMFFNARNFNQPLDNWDVSNVTDMPEMFNGAQNFNQPLDNWNVNMADIGINIPGAAPATVGISNYGNQEGIAFEGHNAFRKINRDKYLHTLSERLTALNATVHPYNTDSFKQLMQAKLPTSSTTPEDEKEKRNRQFTDVWERLSNVNFNEEIKSIVSSTISYMWSSDFSDQQRELYTVLWTAESAEAYEATQNSAENSRIACVQGIIEQFVFSLKNILGLLPETELNTTQKLFLIILTPPEIATLYENWRTSTTIDGSLSQDNPTLFAKATLIKNGGTEILTEEEKTALITSFRKYVKNIFQIYYGEASDAELVKVNPHIEYSATSIQDGGRRKRRNQKKRTIKKRKQGKQQKKKTRKSHK